MYNKCLYFIHLIMFDESIRINFVLKNPINIQKTVIKLMRN